MTGIRVFRGLDAGEGDWPAIIDRRGWRFYLLRGLVVCKKCGWRMAGSASKDACYLCAKHTYLGAQRCHRRIGAARLEAFVTDAAVDLLTHLDVTGTPSAATAPVCDGRGGDQRSLDGHGSGSQVSTSLSTTKVLLMHSLPLQLVVAVGNRAVVSSAGAHEQPRPSPATAHRSAMVHAGCGTGRRGTIQHLRPGLSRGRRSTARERATPSRASTADLWT